jgi:hypothetical protein
VIVAGIARGHQEGGIEADVAASGRPVVCASKRILLLVIDVV